MMRWKGKERSRRVSYYYNEPILGYAVLDRELCLWAAQGSVQRWVVPRPLPLSEVSKCPSLLMQMGMLINWQTCHKSFIRGSFVSFLVPEVLAKSTRRSISLVARLSLSHLSASLRIFTFVDCLSDKSIYTITDRSRTEHIPGFLSCWQPRSMNGLQIEPRHSLWDGCSFELEVKMTLSQLMQFQLCPTEV